MSTHGKCQFIENVDSKERFVANSVKYKLNLNKVSCESSFFKWANSGLFLIYFCLYKRTLIFYNK